MATLNTIRYKNNTTWNTLLNLVYPVGSVYVAWVATSPAILFGGTWSQITGDRFFRFSTNVNTGGDNSHQHWSPWGTASSEKEIYFINGEIYGTKVLTNVMATFVYNAVAKAIRPSRLTAVQPTTITPVYQNMYAWHRTA